MNRWLFVLIIGITAGCNNKPFYTINNEPTDIVINDDTKAVVYIFMVPDCPFSQYYTMAVNQIYGAYHSKGFQFYGIVPGNLYAMEEIDSFKVQYDFMPEIVVDKKYLLSKKFAVSVVPQVVITDAAGEVLYSGKIDDQAIQAGQKKYQPTQFYALDALKSIMQNKPVVIKKTTAVGCFIE